MVKKAHAIEDSSGKKGSGTPNWSRNKGKMMNRETKKGAKPFTKAIHTGTH